MYCQLYTVLQQCSPDVRKRGKKRDKRREKTREKVGHALVGFGVLLGEGLAEVDGELADVDEGQLVGADAVEQEQLHDTVGHEVDGAALHGGAELGVAHVGEVGLLHAPVDEGEGRGDGQLVDVEEGHDAVGLLALAPDLQQRAEVVDRVAREARHVRDEGHQVPQQVRQRLFFCTYHTYHA